MEFIELAQKRQSIRHYNGQPVEREKLEMCLEAARLAPSASNSQPWTFVVVDDHELKEKVARETYSRLVAFNKFVLQAGAVVVMVIEKPGVIAQIGGVIKNKEFSLIDIGMAAEHCCLQASELGQGTCMLGWFNEAPVKTLLRIPPSKTIGLLIAVGYPAGGLVMKEKVRKPFEQVVKYNSYQSKG